MSAKIARARGFLIVSTNGDEDDSDNSDEITSTTTVTTNDDDFTRDYGAREKFGAHGRETLSRDRVSPSTGLTWFDGTYRAIFRPMAALAIARFCENSHTGFLCGKFPLDSVCIETKLG